MSKLDELLRKRQEKHDAAAALLDKDGLTADETKAANTLFDERDAFDGEIKKIQDGMKAAEELRGRAEAGQKFLAEPVRTLPFNGEGGGGDRPDIQLTVGGKSFRIDTGPSEVDKREGMGPFKSIGHLAWCLYKAGPHMRGEPSAVKSLTDWHDLQRKAPSGLFEESDPDAGVLVPRQLSTNIYERAVAQNQILSRLNPIVLTGNTIEIPALKENSRTDGNRGGGVLGYWIGEADQYQKSKPQFRKISLKLHKLTVLVYMTEELMQDSAVAIDSYTGNLAAKEINFKVNDAVIRGTGNGMPLGILNSGSKITQAAVSGQGANTFVAANMLSMYSRVVAGQRGSLIWLYNQDVEPQIFALYQPTGTAAGVLYFTPNQAGTGFNLNGRPMMVVEQAESLGTEGDVIAFATDGYVCATKGGVDSSMNMWIRWDFDEMAIKWRFRFDGQPYDDVPLTPYKGTKTVSSIVTLNSTRT